MRTFYLFIKTILYLTNYKKKEEDFFQMLLLKNFYNY